MFGREMYHFKDWKTEDKIDEVQSLIKRAAEIKTLMEVDIPQAKEIIAQKQVKQRIVQDQQHQVTDELLPIGTTVYVESLMIQNKLVATYHGPYTVDGYTRCKNYWLVNQSKNRLKQSYPRSRLKQVEEISEIAEVEKIIDYRKRKGNIEYLVQWKNQPTADTEWLRAADFDSLEMIEKFENERATRLKKNDE